VEPEEPLEARNIGTPGTAGRDRVDGRKPDGELLNRMLGMGNLFAVYERVVRSLPCASGFLSGRADGMSSCLHSI
jgi:hypothetical protein